MTVISAVKRNDLLQSPYFSMDVLVAGLRIFVCIRAVTYTCSFDLLERLSVCFAGTWSIKVTTQL